MKIFGRQLNSPFSAKNTKSTAESEGEGRGLTKQDIQVLEELIVRTGHTLREEQGLATQRDNALVESTALPVRGGRTSLSDSARTLLSSMLSTIVPDVPFEYLKVMEHLSKWDGDFSYAVDNIVQLSNTDFNIVFDDGVSDEQNKEMQMNLKRAWRNWYNQSEGISSLCGDLFAQLATTGSLSSEIVPRIDLKGVDKTVLVNPVNIRFKYDSERDVNVPFQQVHGAWGGVQPDGLKELNTVTYKYYAIRRINDKPYAIPPMLSSLDSISIEKDMIESVRVIAKKLGMLGFLQVLVSAPAREQGEIIENYQRRCQSYLDSVLPEVDKSLRKGYVVGFKDSHEFKMQDVTNNVDGANKLFEMNSQLKMSGLKQDPLMLGRNFSTTETIGRVILAKLTTQISSYQKIVATFLEEAFTMHLLLQGYKFNFVEVIFERPMVGDKLRDEQVFTARINNYDSLYRQGVITQQQRAQALGYEEAAEEKPLFDQQMEAAGVYDTAAEDDATDPKTTETKSNSKYMAHIEALMMKRALNNLKKSLGGEGKEFDYHGNGCTCGECNKK